MTQDYGVEVDFDQSSCSNHHDQNLIQGTLGYVRKIQEIIEVEFSKGTLGYVRKIQEIIEVEFSSFQCVILGSSGGTPLIGIL